MTPRTRKRETNTETRWAELTTWIAGGREFPSVVGALSDPGESKRDFIDRECCEPAWVVKVELFYTLPAGRGRT